MRMFDDMAREIFAEADFPIEGNEDLFSQAVEILSSKMAMCSAMGLSMKRVEFFELQRKTLVQDLLDIKEDGLPSPHPAGPDAPELPPEAA